MNRTNCPRRPRDKGTETMNGGTKRIIFGTAVLLCGFSSLAIAQQPSQQPAKADALERPQEPGAYYLIEQRWTRMSHVLSAGRRIRRIYSFFVPLVLAPQGVTIFRGAEAPLKIDQVKPLFFLRPTSSDIDPPAGPRDVLIVRLQKKKDHRELPVTSGATLYHWREEIPKCSIIPSTVTSESMGAFSVSPRQNLAPGEYMITFGTGQVGGYDFDIMTGHR